LGGSIRCLERNFLETKDSIRTLIKSDIHTCSMPDTLMIHGAHRNTHQTLMKTIGRGPNREDGWIWMFPKLVIYKFQFTSNSIWSGEKYRVSPTPCMGGGGGPRGPRGPILQILLNVGPVVRPLTPNTPKHHFCIGALQIKIMLNLLVWRGVVW
jgi:hypothetical protein